MINGWGERRTRKLEQIFKTKKRNASKKATSFNRQLSAYFSQRESKRDKEVHRERGDGCVERKRERPSCEELTGHD